jgi:hypothetical protein
MADDPLRYDRMVERALRNVVRDALRETAANGLPGAHHFYITFRTGHAGVVMPEWLRASYPEDITIVLQYQFWGLEAEDDRFQVTLSFNGRNERLEVPYEAITAFADPSVKFGLQFDSAKGELKPGAESAPAQGSGQKPVQGPLQTPALPGAAKTSAEDTGDGEAAKVVTLDAFRKK